MKVFIKIKRWWDARLQHRLMGAFVLTLFTSLTILGILSIITGREGMQAQATQGNRQLAVHLAKQINAEYDTILQMVEALQNELEAPGVTLSLQARTLINHRRSSPLTYQALYLFDDQRQLLIHLQEPLESVLKIEDSSHLVERPSIPLPEEIIAVYDATLSENRFISPIRITDIEYLPVIYIGLPVVVEGGISRQILIAEIGFQDIWKRIDEIFVGQTGRAFIVSSDGLIIAHPDRQYIGQPVMEELMPVTQGYEGQATYVDPISQKIMLASFSPVGRQSKWGVVIEQERDEVFSATNQIATDTLIILIAALVVTFLIASRISRSITQPIQEFVAIVQRIAKEGVLNEAVPIHRHDEVGKLAVSFNQMVDNLRQAEKELRQYSENLEEIVDARTRELQDAQDELIRREKLTTLGKLAGGIAHELRNPLSAIKNTAYLLHLRLDNSGVDVAESLALLDSEILVSERIISSILDFARPKTPSKHLADVNVILQEALSRSNAPEDVTVRIMVEDSMPPILADPDQLLQVFVNLISNAIQAMPEGGQLNLLSQVENQDWISVFVVDTGVGIPAEKMGSVFEPFFTTKAKGIGLGLALVKMLVEGNGGTIDVQSEVGQGTTFTVRLKQVRDEQISGL